MYNIETHELIKVNYESETLGKNEKNKEFTLTSVALTEDEIPEEGRILFVNSDLQLLLNQSVSRCYGSDAAVNTIMGTYNGMKVVYVPASRFITKVDLADGTTGCGFSRASDAENINFMLVYPGSVLQVEKFAMPKIFTPDENQDKDMWKFQFRLYHDCFVYDNKAKGIYLNTAE